MTRPKTVLIREVGPRDGLQAEAPISVEDRVRLIDTLALAGLRNIEVGAFVSPTAVPSMAGSKEVMEAVVGRPEFIRTALVPNERGAEMAVSSGANALSMTISASETYNQRNVRMSIAESLAEARRICAVAHAIPVDGVVSCAFGSPYEGDIDPGTVAALGDALCEAGCTTLTYADTTGMATPRRVRDLLDHTGPSIGLHLHETRGTALASAYAALEAGVARFDTSVGGLGGSPFADGAAGNLATEDLVHLLDDLEVSTGVDLERLLDASKLAEALVGHPVPSRIAAAGPRSRRASS